jgi:hypothetical protein
MHSVIAQPAMGYHGLQWLCFKPIAGLLLDNNSRVKPGLQMLHCRARHFTYVGECEHLKHDDRAVSLQRAA